MAEGAKFASGVYGYIHGRTTIDVFFPVDAKGNADVSCRQCPYLRSQSNTCALNDSVIAYPQKFVGVNCPLEMVDDEAAGLEMLYGELDESEKEPDG